MSHLATSLHVEATPTALFDLIADPARSPDWQTILVGMGEIVGRIGSVGSSYVGYYRVAGRRLTGRFVVTASERPGLFQVNTTTIGGWARWTTMIVPTASGSDISIQLEYELPGEIMGSLLRMLTGNRLEREFLRSYENLRRVAEAAGLTAARRRSPAPGLGIGLAPASDAGPALGAPPRPILEVVPGGPANRVGS